MNILLVSPLPPPAGGIASWTKRYLESDFAKQHNVDVVNISVIGNRAQNFTRKKRILDELQRLRGIIIDLKEKINKKKYDVVHINSSCSKTGLLRDVIVAQIIKKNNLKAVVHFRCDVSYMVKGKISTLLLKKLVRLCDKVLTLNSVSHDYIEALCKKKSVIVSNFVSDDYVNIKRKELRPTVKRVLFAGHVTRKKGCDLIYKVAENFCELEFVLVGHISDEIRKLNKPENVTLVGEVSAEELKTEYLNSDVFLFPTHTEGFPNALAEAMACGLPVITTAVGAIPDMIEKVGGILIDIDDIDGCINALNESLLIDKRKTMSDFNYKKVNEKYTINSVLNDLYRIYVEI